MRVHILGIGGTFMVGIAQLAKSAGHMVTGSDINLYPPMSTQLELAGIKVYEGYDDITPLQNVDCVIIGNVMKRGLPVVEHILNSRIPFQSGPQWLYENILRHKHVIAISGTHGKTTTTSLVTWIVEFAGLNPSFLIGGVPENFGVSARLTDSPYFVIEADEYDTAFFDKRSKFIHYYPNTLILNNVEFDHADIFTNLDAIKAQFHHLVRTVAGDGKIIFNANDANVVDVLEKGCWSDRESFGHENADWQAELTSASGEAFNVLLEGKNCGEVNWSLLGNHNVQNALAAIAAAHHVGIPIKTAIHALQNFKNVKRRMELKAIVNDISFYDDFAHHPTAIATTLSGLKSKIGKNRILAVIEFGSYTMRTGVHKDYIGDSFHDADYVFCKFGPHLNWDVKEAFKNLKNPIFFFEGDDSLAQAVAVYANPHDSVIVLSNTGFNRIHQTLVKEIEKKYIPV